MKPLMSIRNLNFSYEKNQNILENINLEVFEKDFLAIIGPNGGGKSTLLKLILKLLKPNSGKVELSVNKNLLGYVPQNTNLNINFPITALEVVLMGHIGAKRRVFGYTKEQKLCALNSLEQVGMKEHANTKIGNLSGGQRQRVFIARALCAHPKIILLDEPTASIDVKGQKEIYDLLKDLNQSITLIVVSHDISVLLHYAKNVAHVNKTLVYHPLDTLNTSVDVTQNHYCEVELLKALSYKHECDVCQ
jgi:zinc transport system ATP-binding protein